MLEDRGALPKEDGKQLREYKAMHEENVASSWMRTGTKKPNEKKTKSGKREVEREGERVEIKRKCVYGLSCDFFKDFSPKGDEWECDGDSLVFLCLFLRRL